MKKLRLGWLSSCIPYFYVMTKLGIFGDKTLFESLKLVKIGSDAPSYAYICSMIEVNISNEIAAAAPGLEVWVLECDVENPPTADGLWREIEQAAAEQHDTVAIEAVNKLPGIVSVRAAYKALGKEPNRYRPSSEALMRRCVKGLGLYRTLTIIDLTNLVSLVSGHSIGAFDADAIEGGSITLGVGREGEPYEAIGRGQLNIACLPVFRDAIGGVGTPTSDNDRTKLSENTRRLLMTVNMYGEGRIPANETIGMLDRLLRKYAGATEISVRCVKAVSGARTQD